MAGNIREALDALTRLEKPHQWTATQRRELLSTIRAHIEALEAERDALREDAARLDYIERTFSGMTNRERYLPVQMVWGKGAMGRTLREACDKYRKRDQAMQGTKG